MPYTNPWVGYLDRGYREIKQSLLTRLIAKAPEITDHSESNVLIILMSMFAGIAEMLGLYIDNMAREAFIQTAERFVSGVRLVKLIDYRVKAAIAATADISVVAVDNSGELVATNAPYTIPAFTAFTTQSGIQFLNTAAVVVPVGSLGVVVPVRQISLINNLNIGTSDGSTAGQQFPLGTSYVHNSVNITILGSPWTEVNSFGLALATDQVFVVEIGVDGIAYATFGDGINGAIPPAVAVIASYYETLGANGNVDAQTITNASPTITLPTATTTQTKIYNQDAASGGVMYEDIRRLRVSAPLSLRTLDRAVTFQDYEDIGRLAPGVGLAKVDFSCGKTVDLYISPQGGGIATTPLLTSTTNFFETRRMVTTFVNVKAAGETRLKISMDVTAKFRADTTLCLADVQNALLDYGAFENQAINRKVRVSDIVAKVDNLARVDFLDLTNLGTIPYARPINHNVQLIWDRETLEGSNSIVRWFIEFDTATFFFRVFRNQEFMGNIPGGTLWTDPHGSLTAIFYPGPYINGANWRFTTYPFLKNIELDDFTVPKVDLLDLNITVNEQLNPPI